MQRAPNGNNVSRIPLWFGLIGGAVAWTIHLLCAYAIAEFGCVGEAGHRDHMGVSFVAWLELGLTALTLAIAAVATAVAFHTYRKRRAIAASGDAAAAAEQHAAWAGLLTSGLFTFVILFESIPILYYLRSC